MTTVYDFSADTLAGKSVSLSEFKGKVLLIVNTASKCGFTPQYKGLEELYDKYQAQGLEILGFPCNQFGSQEPGSATDIQSFCEMNYGVKFPLFAKIDVNGAHAHPLYTHLKTEAPGILGLKDIKWNFTKFLIGRDGAVLERFAPTTPPQSIEADIQKALSS
jgi:glutathione peroxidase